MGRYLCNGIVTKFSIEKRNSWSSDKNFNIEKELKSILKDLDQTIDTSLYELCEKNDDCIVYSLKPEIYNNHIHELIQEISPLTFPNVDYFSDFEEKLKEKKLDLNNPEWVKQFPLQYTVDKKQKDNTMSEFILTNQFCCTLHNEKVRNNVEISGNTLLLWIDYNKYVGEDETVMLDIMNHMKTKYYSTKLSGALVYCVPW